MNKAKHYSLNNGIKTDKTFIMKNIILASATLLFAFTSTYAANDKNADRQLVRDLSSSFKKSTQTKWVEKDQYRQAAFLFKNKAAYAFYSTANDLIGFGFQLNQQDMPEVVSEVLKAKYSDWSVMEAMTFIETDGDNNYFVRVKKDNKQLALKITPAGKTSVFARM